MNVDSNLDSTNKIIDLLERKLSFMSNSTSSHNSVIITKNLDSKNSNISSNVLNYIKSTNSSINNTDFDTNNLFIQRENKLLNKTKSASSLAGADNATNTNADTNTNNNDDDDQDYFTDDDVQDEEHPYDLLIASPPRSPPREVDPDRLYGLYDFNGPDPSHCNIKRDEPVLLINDDDNYWWLIKKTSKDEKIGFAPAECLETYGERLARLNCFKNEELEKNHRNIEVKKPARIKTNKSVTFNSDFDDDYLDDEINDDEEVELDIGEDDVYHQNDAGNQFDSHLDDFENTDDDNDDKESEVLSDVYPTEPLLVSKNLKSKFGSLTRYTSAAAKKNQSKKYKSSHTPPPLRKSKFDEFYESEIESQQDSNNLLAVPINDYENESVISTYSDYNQPPNQSQITKNNNQTLSSIGSFSPDTETEESPNLRYEERFQSNSMVINRVGDILNRKINENPTSYNSYDKNREKNNHNMKDENSKNFYTNGNDSSDTNDTINGDENTPESNPLKSPMSVNSIGSMKLLDDLINEQEFHITDTIDSKIDPIDNESDKNSSIRNINSRDDSYHNKTLSNLSSSSYNTNNSNQSLNNINNTPLTSTNSINQLNEDLSKDSISINSNNSTIKIDQNNQQFNELFNPILLKFDELSQKLLDLEKLIS